MEKKKQVPERTDKPLAERYVSMSNAITRSAQGLSLSEKRVVAMGLAKTDSVPAKDLVMSHARAGWSVRIAAHEYAEAFGLDLNTSYEQLKAAGDHLRTRYAQIVEETPRGRKISKINWVGKVVYHEGEGWVEVHFFHEIAPHLLALRERFTTFKLKQVVALRSVYSWRLFECLQSWKSKGIWSVSIEEFHRVMETPPSVRKDFKALRIRVLEPAIAELSNKENMLIKLDLEKAGRKITGLVFKFQPDPQGRLEL